MDALGALLVGLLLRFGIPILLTIVVVLLLRRLDAYWQAEAEKQFPEGVGLVPQIRCWVLKDCPQESREQCPAYAQAEKPCWQVFRDGNGRMREDCLGCDVFRRAPVPTPA